jgi:hypothetical protein
MSGLIQGRDGCRKFQRFALRENLSGFPLRGDITGEDLTIVLQRFHGRELDNVLRTTDFVAREVRERAESRSPTRVACGQSTIPCPSATHRMDTRSRVSARS